MGWFDYITDPSEMPLEVYQALQALNTLTAQLGQADNISFRYDVFYSAAIATVGEALRQIADYMASAGRQLVTLPDLGTALVDATMAAQFITHKTGTLGLGVIYLSTAAVGSDVEFQVMKNGTTLYSFSFIPGETGPRELDLSFISVVKNDLIGIYCVKANGAKGLAVTVEF